PLSLPVFCLAFFFLPPLPHGPLRSRPLPRLFRKRARKQTLPANHPPPNHQPPPITLAPNATKKPSPIPEPATPYISSLRSGTSWCSCLFCVLVSPHASAISRSAPAIA